MRTLFFTSVTLMMCFCLNATETVLDTAYMECLYKYSCNIDTLGTADNNLLKRRGSLSSDILVLNIGKNVSHCYSYNRYKYDSISNALKIKHKSNPMAVIEELRTLNLPQGLKWHIYKDYPIGKISYKEPLINENYLYEEDKPGFNWEIQDDTLTILGYVCQKAVCEFRGRKYETWFTMELPISDGPWKFSGLPGLILKINDIQNHYAFELVGIRQVFNVPILFDDTKIIKSDRKKFLGHKRKFLVDPVGFINFYSGGKIYIKPLDGNEQNNKLLEARELGYDFIEKDYR